MAGGGPRTKPSNWPLILQAVGTGFTILVVVVGALMAYSYMNGSVSTRLENVEKRVAELERRERH